jgi:hypothetical protein
MLVVLASRHDAVALDAVGRWRAGGTAAELLCGADLACAGWRLASDGTSTAVVGGRRVEAGAITGVVSRLAAVTPDEIPEVHAADRHYAAAEMSAFLLAWIASLRCPVLNRATPGSLAGPAWSQAQWTACAARAGLAIRPLALGSSAVPGGPAARAATVVVQVVGETSLGGDESARRAALALARAAGVDLLRVVLEPGARSEAPLFVSADPWVDLGDAEVAGAVARRAGA